MQKDNMVNILDVLNSNINYTAKIILSNKELNTEKNKFLLTNGLIHLTCTNTGIKKLKEYFGEDIEIGAAEFVKRKAELLKQLGLYKSKDYFN